jgi:hypothetical protein
MKNIDKKTENLSRRKAFKIFAGAGAGLFVGSFLQPIKTVFARSEDKIKSNLKVKIHHQAVKRNNGVDKNG